ncbi:hypothetical protein RHS01_08892 [Rhizoctonia solani]|uniref:Betaine lipid synthase n=1 Tax=Rhizoctonia solani TaxID=456999 RepID=A0A8H7I686_9AGAM|nr:hypothetical protein RHS01_08892 [Rhizoctonia solani]
MALFIGLVVLYSSYDSLKAPLRFVWHCFLRPLGKSANQQDRLDQVLLLHSPNRFSSRLLMEGRRSFTKAKRKYMILLDTGYFVAVQRCLNSQLHTTRAKEHETPGLGGHWRRNRSVTPLSSLVPCFISLNTSFLGWNIETMDAYLPIKQFDAIYLVDLCDPLLQIARKRFAAKGWTNVHIIHSDACTFRLPDDQSALIGSVSLVTLSYSLSMIPTYHRLLDRVDRMLDATHGLVGVVDFYASRKCAGLHEESIGGVGKVVGWLGHWFWQMWFDLDHVDLSPGRRDYLQYKFGTVKILNGRNGMFLPWFIQIPYYVWLGCSRSVNVSAALEAFETDSGNSVGNYSPKSAASTSGLKRVASVIKLGEDGSDSEVEVDTQLEHVVPPSSAFHYHSQTPWRLPYYTHAVHNEFRTFIYAFTWEDPMEDMNHLELTKDSSILCISSAGDNALHYAIAAGPRRIHCVDMNPCQGHLVELKLAALRTLSHPTFFDMFGSGKLPDFKHILDGELSPWLSSAAYHFGNRTKARLTSRFIEEGIVVGRCGSRRYVFLGAVGPCSGGVLEDAKRMCDVDTIEEQARIWREKLRPVLLSNWFVKLVLNNPAFLWNALGVPLAQRRAFLNEGSCYEFARDTLDPIASTALLKTGPTITFYVLCGMQPGQLTHAVIMDHLDWFDPGAKEVEEEVAQLRRVLLPGNAVFWRSAARKPWYCEVFERNGFSLTPLGVRTGPERAIDRVNMYASFWKAVRAE